MISYECCCFVADVIHRSGWNSASDSSIWIQVDLLHTYVINKMATAGRAATNRFIVSYTLQYSSDTSTWHTVVDSSGSDVTFDGNSNGDDIVENEFGPIVARHVRLDVVEFNSNPAMRWEVYGCFEGNFYTSLITMFKHFYPPTKFYIYFT